MGGVAEPPNSPSGYATDRHPTVNVNVNREFMYSAESTSIPTALSVLIIRK